MKELKTLRDMKPFIRGNSKIHFTPEQRSWIRKELQRIRIEDKAEAIKWVKEDTEEHDAHKIILKWMERLNITEEDLK